VLLVERGIIFDLRGAGRGAAVDKEVDGVEGRPKNSLRPVRPIEGSPTGTGCRCRGRVVR
jgi:hypothetical protein